MKKDAGSSTAASSCEFTFQYPLPQGLHARPANRLVQVTQQFSSDISLTNQRTQSTGDAKSLLSLLALDVAESDECGVVITGPDAEEALAALQAFLRDTLPSCDEPAPTAASEADLPAIRALQDAAHPIYTGTRIHGGVARGTVVVLGGFGLPPELAEEPAATVAEERQRVERARDAVQADLLARRASSSNATERDILDAHLTILRDRGFDQELERCLSAGKSAGAAVVEAGRHFNEVLLAAASALTRERAADVQDICVQMLERICGGRVQAVDPPLSEPSIVVAEDLTPSRLLALDRRFLRGLILERAGATSHAMILAASFDLPTLTNVTNGCIELGRESELILDANCGVALPAGHQQTEAYYARVAQREERRRERWARLAEQESRTSDGQRLVVSANVSTVPEVAQAIQHGADGIGLFRTELLFMDRKAPPTEEEQVALYTEAARAADGRPVTIRTLDVGGDKPLPYLNLGQEANPFLGYRGVRLYSEHADLFRAQVRAILRASAFGRLKLMLPMITTLQEVAWFKTQLTRLQDELSAEGHDFDKNMPVGIMVEVPSVVFLMNELAEQVDFFSIGTNDLAQYFFAAERGNPRVSALCDTNQASFLRMLKMIVTTAHSRKRPVSMCGEMAREVSNLPRLIGLDLDEISVARSETLRLKAALSDLSASDCRAVTRIALAGENGEATQEQQATGPAISERDLILTDRQADSREAVIAELVDALYVTARTDTPGAVENAVWNREETCSTAVGHGFAIPHCRTDAVNANSFAVLRLIEPISWADDGSTPVQFVVLLAVRESNSNRTHMQVLAKLARSLMRDDFRASLLAAPSSDALLECLFEELDLDS